MHIKLRHLPTAMGLGLFLALSYTVCTVWDAVFPSWRMYPAWGRLLPGFTWWSWASFFLGLAETFLYGFWLALVVVLVGWAHGVLRAREAGYAH